MPTTLTRNYPYPPITGEAPNVALHMQQLAEAIDTDMTSVAATIDPNALQSLTTQVTGLNNQATLLAARVTAAENRTKDVVITRVFNADSNTIDFTLPGQFLSITVAQAMFQEPYGTCAGRYGAPQYRQATGVAKPNNVVTVTLDAGAGRWNITMMVRISI